MQNFGRGMWRRVGDFERIHKPMLIQQSRLEQWQQFIQYQTMLKKKQQYMEQKQKQVDTKVVQDISIEENESVSIEENESVSIEENESVSIEENEIKQNIDIIEIQEIQEVQQEYSEPPVVIPKKTKRKNKNK
jgi:hypothetical protein